MATAIILLIIVIICIFSIKSYSNKLSHGCCGASGDGAKKIKPQDRNKKNYSYVFKLNIQGMTCNHCKITVENAFNENEGFYAEVNLKDNSAVVRTKQKITDDELKRIVQREGYKVTGITQLEN